ncbi:MAG TPA: efflux RND transporter periplasmic adaptor subunit [Burkholderiaceae bacterium]|nr:efflux RND transporter periplasmic adaptor subunit [Burkholderiaceae bacterium]
MKPRSLRAILGPASALMSALALMLVGCGGKADAQAPGKAAAQKPALTVTTTTPQIANWPRTLTATGNIAAWQEASVGSEIGGLRLAEVLVNVGDRVSRGQLLARLQSETVQAEIAQTRANLAEAQAAGAEAHANAERARQLQTTGAISAQQISQYFTAEQTAHARAQALRARLQADELRLSQTQIKAPDDGVISARIAAVGAVVQPGGQELFRLIRQQRLEWRAEVAAPDLGRLKPGMKAQVTAPSGAKVPGTVRMVAPTVDPQTRNGLVYVDLKASADAKAGMFARGEFELGSAGAMTLPQSAVLTREGFAYVFRVTPDNKVQQVKVSLGRRLGERIEITSGIEPETRVVAIGAGFLSDGDTVRVVEQTVPTP